jgi:hypothetical protein
MGTPRAGEPDRRTTRSRPACERHTPAGGKLAWGGQPPGSPAIFFAPRRPATIERITARRYVNVTIAPSAAPAVGALQHLAKRWPRRTMAAGPNKGGPAHDVGTPLGRASSSVARPPGA